MSQNQQTGKTGEELAKAYLESRGYVVTHTNWRYSYYEIDIIAQKDNYLHFIEVKTRRSQQFGPPELAVSKKKLRFLKQAAEQFLYQYPQWKNVQFDIISVFLGNESEPDCFFIEDVF